MDEIEDKDTKIRDIINGPFKNEELLSDPTKWSKICSCLDVLGDAQEAINCFYKQPDFSGFN